MNYYIIGAGGVGSILIMPLVRLHKPQSIIVVDGDSLEQKNLDRQMYRPEHVGLNKAEALAMIHGTRSIPDYFSYGSFQPSPEDILFCCVDNHPGRLAALQTCDLCRCSAILAANETHSAEAFFYQPEWKETDRDPRSYIPELTQDTTDDPVREGSGCTGEAQQANRQLVTANFMAAALAMHLHVLWNMEAPKLEAEVVDRLPHKLTSTLSRLESHRIGS